METLFPVPGRTDVALEDVLGGYAYPPLAGGRWWLRASMLSSVDGAVAGPDGRSGSLSTQVDRRLFAHLRTLADAVLVGAGTARSENYGPPNPAEDVQAARVAAGLAPRARLVVVSRSLSLDQQARLFTGPDRVVVVTSRSADWNDVERLGQVADVVRVGDEAVDLRQLLGLLADRGLPRVLCEGGPGLLADVVADGLLDELCLTTVPTMAAGPAARIATGRPADPLVGLSLTSMARDEDGTLLSRWVRA